MEMKIKIKTEVSNNVMFLEFVDEEKLNFLLLNGIEIVKSWFALGPFLPLYILLINAHLHVLLLPHKGLCSKCVGSQWEIMVPS